MSSFFESEVVRAEMTEIQELQEEVYDNVFKFPSMPKDEKMHHIEILEKLVKKQKIMYARVSLSDDPEAKEMKKRIIEGASAMGIPPHVDMQMMFDQMNQMIGLMKHQLDNDQFKM
tara:strand:- start:82 stop:429 length:348 start_codon:yes stop_codon:yes gene_type:complete